MAAPRAPEKYERLNEDQFRAAIDRELLLLKQKVNALGELNRAGDFVLPGGLVLTGDLLPATDLAYDLGSLTKRWNIVSPHLTSPVIDSGGLVITAGALQAQAVTTTTLTSSGLILANAGLTVPSGQALTLTSANVVGAPTWGSTQTLNTTGFAATLQTARSFTITGDLSWTVSFNGSANVSAAGTLATVNSNVGAFGSSTAIPTVTVNAKGLVTAVSTNAVIAPAGTLTGTTLASNVVNSSLTSVGILASPHFTSPVIDSGGLTITSGTLTGQAATFTAVGMTGDLGTTGARVPKGWFTDLVVTNAIAGSVTGSAATLTTPRAITITGDLSWTVAFDGSAAVSAAGTLATVNSNVGSFGSSTSIPTFTVNAKGLITAASGNAVIAPAGTLTGTTLASNVVTSSLTTVGVLASPHVTTLTVDSGGITITSGTLSAQAIIGTTLGLTGDIGTTSSRITKGWFTDLTVTNTISGSVTGSAATLTTARDITMTGDVSWTVSFNGSANVSAAGTLATVATAGTTGGSTAIPVITINAKGLTTSITTAAVIAPAGTLTGTTLASNVVTSSLTTVGVLASPHMTTLTVDSGGITITAGTLGAQDITATTITATSNVMAGAATEIGWTGRATMKSGADGLITLFNDALSGFTRLNFGGTSASEPAIKRSSATLQFRLADDSDYADVRGAAATFTTVTANVVGNVTGNVTGSAATLSPGRSINGVLFDGSAAITVTAAAGTLTGSTLAAGVTASSLTSVGVLASPHMTSPVIDSGALRHASEFDIDSGGTEAVRINRSGGSGGFKVFEAGTTTENLFIANGGAATFRTNITQAAGTAALQAVTATTVNMSGALTYGGVTLTAAVTGTGKMVLQSAPLLDGNVTFNGIAFFESTAPRIRLNDTNGTTDKRIIDIAYNTNVIDFEARNDAGSFVRNVLSLAHDGGATITGTLVASSTIQGTDIVASVANGSVQMRNNTNVVEHHLRPSSGKSGWLTYTEDSVADRWGVGIKNGDGTLYFSSGGIGAFTDRATISSAGVLTALGATIRVQPASGTATLGILPTGTDQQMQLLMSRSGGSFAVDWYYYVNASNTILRWNGAGSDVMTLTTAGLLTIASDFVVAATKKIYTDGGGDTYMQEDSANRFLFVAGGGNAAVLTSTDTAIATTTTANAANLYQGGSMLAVLRSTSSRLNKQDITTLGEDTAERIIFDARPVTYRSRLANDDQSVVHLGFIAEEVKRLWPALVTGEGDQASLAYDRFVAPLVVVAQDHQRRIAELEAEIKTLRGHLKPLPK